MGLLDKLMFWRKDDPASFEVEGCFTLPGAELEELEELGEVSGTDDADCAAPIVQGEAEEAADSEI